MFWNTGIEDRMKRLSSKHNQWGAWSIDIWRQNTGQTYLEMGILNKT
jgi:hypothetical protein